MSNDYSEKKNKTLDNVKAENHNCMGFRNFTFKPFKLEGFPSYAQLLEGWQNAVFTCLTIGFPTSVGGNMASGGCLQKRKRRKLQVKVLFLIKKKKRPPTPKLCAFFFDLLFL